jgi:lysophospholipase L1-like esterase
MVGATSFIPGAGVIKLPSHLEPTKEAPLLSTRLGMVGVRLFGFAAALTAFAVGGAAEASTLTQNTSWTIDRPSTTARFRVVAYGDSIYAGYRGSLSRVAKRAAPWAAGEYASTAWNSDVEVIRRAKSGARANDIYNNKIVAERSYMQATNTRVVTFEMCGNDYLQARSALSDQSGTCNFSGIESALASCTQYMELGMQAVNQYATTAPVKIISNLYYPGYDADNVNTNCTDPATGQPANKQERFLPFLARSNWRACNLASQYGFQCADTFAAWMGAEYDSNGDGAVDTDALRYVQGESEDAYVQRISVTLRSTIRDANGHLADPSTSFDYLLSDNTHPTFTGSTVFVGIFGGTGSGSGPPDFADGQIVDTRNPVWNAYGHEMMGRLLALFGPAAP